MRVATHQRLQIHVLVESGIVGGHSAVAILNTVGRSTQHWAGGRRKRGRCSIIGGVLQRGNLLREHHLLVLVGELLDFALQGVVLIDLRVQHERDFIDLNRKEELDDQSSRSINHRPIQIT